MNTHPLLEVAFNWCDSEKQGSIRLDDLRANFGSALEKSIKSFSEKGKESLKFNEFTEVFVQNRAALKSFALNGPKVSQSVYLTEVLVSIQDLLGENVERMLRNKQEVIEKIQCSLQVLETQHPFSDPKLFYSFALILSVLAHYIEKVECVKLDLSASKNSSERHIENLSEQMQKLETSNKTVLRELCNLENSYDQLKMKYHAESQFSSTVRRQLDELQELHTHCETRHKRHQSLLQSKDRQIQTLLSEIHRQEPDFSPEEPQDNSNQLQVKVESLKAAVETKQQALVFLENEVLQFQELYEKAKADHKFVKLENSKLLTKLAQMKILTAAPRLSRQSTPVKAEWSLSAQLEQANSFEEKAVQCSFKTRRDCGFTFFDLFR